MIKGNIEEMLSVEGVYIATTAGVSMFPLLRNRKDNAVILPKPRKLNRFDVVLYKRDNVYILHRIVDIKDGSQSRLVGRKTVDVECTLVSGTMLV